MVASLDVKHLTFPEFAPHLDVLLLWGPLCFPLARQKLRVLIPAKFSLVSSSLSRVERECMLRAESLLDWKKGRGKERSYCRVFFGAFCLAVRTLTFSRLMGFPLNH